VWSFALFVVISVFVRVIVGVVCCGHVCFVFASVLVWLSYWYVVFCVFVLFDVVFVFGLNKIS
jgi:hypothetical protein